MSDEVTQPLRVSLTNVTGLGAAILARSLVPVLEACPALRISKYYVSETSEFLEHDGDMAGRLEVYRRILPNSLSRILECTVLAGYFDGPEPLLVMGDLPLATKAPQIVFVQSPHIVRDVATNGPLDRLRYKVARAIVRRNQHRVAAFIVQSDVMRDGLADTYRIEASRIHIIPQPPPGWLLQSGLARNSRSPGASGRLRLFYPAAAYPHKNHDLLAGAQGDPAWGNLIEKWMLTVEPDMKPVAEDWLQCAGRLGAEAVIDAYRHSDAMVFLSKSESFGFPLVEAMWVGLPVVCPDLPYARTLCGDKAIYFNVDDLGSLKEALVELRTRLDEGWWPDWTDQLKTIPSGWDEVADAFGSVIASLDRQAASAHG